MNEIGGNLLGAITFILIAFLISFGLWLSSNNEITARNLCDKRGGSYQYTYPGPDPDNGAYACVIK